MSSEALHTGLEWLYELANDNATHWQPRARALLAEVARLEQAVSNQAGEIRDLTECMRVFRAQVARLEQEVANAVGDREHVAMRRKLWRGRAERAEAALAVARGDEAEARKGIAGHGRVREANPAVGPLPDRVADSAQTIRGAFWHGQGLGGHNNYRAAEDALAELLAALAVARERAEKAEQERDYAAECRDNMQGWAKRAEEAARKARVERDTFRQAAQFHAREAAVAREREQQRHTKALERIAAMFKRSGATTFSFGSIETVGDIARAALVDEPAADESLTEEGGVNESSSGVHGQQMSPLPSPGNDRSGRSSASTSPPAVSDSPAAATLAEPGRRGANEPAVVLGEASLPGSASAAADEPCGCTHTTVWLHNGPYSGGGSCCAETVRDCCCGRNVRLRAAADEPGETPA